MKVRVGDQWFDSNDVAIAVKFSDEDLKNIEDMKEHDSHIYASFPSRYNHAGEMQSWMKVWK